MTERTHRHHWLRRLFGRARVELARAWDEIYWPGRHPAPETDLGPAPRGWVLGPDLADEADAEEEPGAAAGRETEAEAEDLPWHEQANYGNWHYPKAEAEAAGQEAAIDHALASRDADADIEADIEETTADDGLVFHGPLEEDEARIQELSDALDAEREAEIRREQLAQEEADLTDTRDWVRDVAVERVYAGGIPDGMTFDEAIDNEVAVMYEEDTRRIERGERALFLDQPAAGPAADADDDGLSVDAARWTPDLDAEAGIDEEFGWFPETSTPCPVELRPDGQITGPEYGDPAPAADADVSDGVTHDAYMHDSAMAELDDWDMPSPEEQARQDAIDAQAAAEAEEEPAVEDDPEIWRTPEPETGADPWEAETARLAFTGPAYDRWIDQRAAQAENEARNEADYWGEMAIAWRERPGGEAEYEADADVQADIMGHDLTTMLDDYGTDSGQSRAAEARPGADTSQVLSRIDAALAEASTETGLEIS